jgi:hypothetical protein
MSLNIELRGRCVGEIQNRVLRADFLPYYQILCTVFGSALDHAISAKISAHYSITSTILLPRIPNPLNSIITAESSVFNMSTITTQPPVAVRQTTFRQVREQFHLTSCCQCPTSSILTKYSLGKQAMLIQAMSLRVSVAKKRQIPLVSYTVTERCFSFALSTALTIFL